jgi:ferredoxin-NADP reductase
MIAMRMRETGFKTALMSAALGAKFRVSRPRGSFTLHKDFARPAVFLAGGIGITPVRSILDWAVQERMPHKLYLFYSNREAVDAAFLEELEALTMQNPRFTLIPTITRLTYSAWRYEVGHINPQLLWRYLTGLNRPVFYVAGPSGMVTSMTNLLRSLDVSEDDMRLCKPLQFFHVPHVIALSMNLSLCSQQVKRCEFQVAYGLNRPAVAPIRIDIKLRGFEPCLCFSMRGSASPFFASEQILTSATRQHANPRFQL